MRWSCVLVAVLGCNPEYRQALEDLATLEAAMEGYRTWDQHPDWTGVGESLDGTHGTHVQMWFDDAFLATLLAASGDPMPTGAVAVKEGYDDPEGGDPEVIVAHQRKEDGSLFYAKWDDGGEVEEFGRPELCVDCHRLGQDEVMALTW